MCIQYYRTFRKCPCHLRRNVVRCGATDHLGRPVNKKKCPGMRMILKVATRAHCPYHALMVQRAEHAHIRRYNARRRFL